jgi:Spy/CpxP family protein refolding chaperone
MNMKRILTSALVLALSIGAAQAQSKGTKGGKHQGMEQKMDYEKLNLSADQEAKMKVMNADFRKQQEELRNNKSLSAEQIKTRRQELLESYKTQANAILTAEQKETLANQRSENTGQVKEGKMNKKGDRANRDTSSFSKKGGRKEMNKGNDMMKDLNLSADQQTKMAAIRTQYKTKMEALRNDNSLTEDQKKARLMELRKAQNIEINALLTPEQREKMKSGRKDRALNTK